MSIKILGKVKTTFGQVSPGQVFRRGGDLYMKVFGKTSRENQYYALDMERGELLPFEDEYVIYPCTLEVLERDYNVK